MRKSQFPLCYPWDAPFWEDEEGNVLEISHPSGLSVYEDEKFFSIEAALPGIPIEDIDVSCNHGHVFIKGSQKKEEEGKKYYRKAHKSFSYRAMIPSYVDTSEDPQATYKDGILKLTFSKKGGEKKKISIKGA